MAKPEAKIPAQSVPLEAFDPEVYDLLQHEQTRQWSGLELIASENFTSRAVMDALGSCFTNKYSEGYPGARFYGGNEHIDKLERLCQDRALAAFHLDAKEWGVNVQPYSGSPANFAVYNALLKPHDRLMGLDLPSGGHLTHGFYTAKKKISATSIYFESMPYKVDPKTYQIDYDDLEKQADVFRPKMLVCGASAFPNDWDYARLRKIANKVGALLMCDMAHISGLVAAQVVNDPFAHCHIVTTTTHKSLRGPRAGVIFFRRDPPKPAADSKEAKDAKDAKTKAPEPLGLEAKINESVFPSLQGGPHNNTIAAIAVQLKEVNTPEFVQYAKDVVANAKALAAALIKMGHSIAANGTTNHLLLWDVRPLGLNGYKMQHMCELVSITLNKNTIAGDTNALSPSGVRIGTPALTSRGLDVKAFEQVATFLDSAAKIGKTINDAITTKNKTIDDFKAASADPKYQAEITALRNAVENFAKTFYMPGFDVSKLRYK